MLTALKTAVI